MIHEFPDYYKKFRCIGGRCKDSCCIGWEIDIDEDTYDYYQNVGGAFGERLRGHMAKQEERSFVLQSDNRCPFLNKQNLCDIFTELGEESLCRICTEYPRYHELAGNYEQSDMSLSCMELCRIFFATHAKIKYELRKDKTAGEEISREEQARLNLLLLVRNTAIHKMQDRSVPWQQRITAVYTFVQEVQKAWNEEDWKRVKHICRKKRMQKPAECSADGIKRYLMDILTLMQEMEVMDDAWETALEHTVSRMSEAISCQAEFQQCMQGQLAVWYEKIMVYFIFRYFLRSLYDGNLLAKLQFAVVGLGVIYIMDIVRFLDNGRGFTLEDQIDIAHLYSKEVEHSEENIAYIFDELMFWEFGGYRN